MAGSYQHVTNPDGSFAGTGLIEDGGDAYECIEEMWYMINYLTNGDKKKIHEAWQKGYAFKFITESNRHLFTYEKFWEEISENFQEEEE